MNCISSFRPFKYHNGQYEKNQIAAWETWHEAFDTIIYFNDPEPRLSSDYTLFIPSEPFPRIHQMAEFASYQKDWSCIINADICVGHTIHNAMRSLKTVRAKAACSWRFEFDPAVGLWPNSIVDPGMDWFAATPDVWAIIAQIAPDTIRIGFQRWDSWMLCALNTICPKQFYAVTRHRFIFHPKHGDRKYGGGVDRLDEMNGATWPMDI